MTFKNIVPGDELWVVNGFGTSAFEADVIEVTEEFIAVSVPDKGKKPLLFERGTGEAFLGPEVSRSFLAWDDDPRVKAALDNKAHAYWHREVIDRASAVRKSMDKMTMNHLEQAILEWKKLLPENSEN